MELRHEFKHEISYCDMLALRARLSAIMQQDSHAMNGKYQIRSLYFDNLNNKALLEKINGVNRREKFRLRCYNGDTSLIFLEKKTKENGLCGKIQTVVNAEKVSQILNGEPFDAAGNRLLVELKAKMITQQLRPKTIVDYTREPFVFFAGNVRVTIDHDIRTGISGTDFLNPHCPTIPVNDSPIILEVKWDEFLPSVIRDIIQLPETRTTAFSKYAACRTYD